MAAKSSLSASERTILQNTSWLVLGEGAYRGSRFVLTVLLARHLGADSFGKWSFALALAALFAILANFGLPTLTVRDIAVDRGHTRSYVGNMVVLKVLLGLATLAIIGVLGAVLGSGRDEIGLIYLLGVFVVVASYGELFDAVFRGHDRMEFEAYAKLLLAGCLLVLGGTLVWKSAPLLSFGVAYIVAAAFSAAFGLVLLFRRFGGFSLGIDLDFWKATLRAAFPIMLATIAFIAYFRIDLVMLSQMKGDLETGLYSAAYNFVLPAVYLPVLLVTALYPTLSRQAGDISAFRQSYVRATGMLLVYGMVVAAALVGTRQIVYLWLFGGEYQDSVTLIPIFVGTMALFILAHLNYFVLYAKRREGVVLAVTVASLAVNVALNIALIPKFGMHGAAVSTVATQAFVLAALLVNNREVASGLWRRA